MEENPYSAPEVQPEPRKRYTIPPPYWTGRRIAAIGLRVIFAFALLTAIRMGIGAFSAPMDELPLVAWTAIGAAVVSAVAWYGAHLLGYRAPE